MLIKKGVALEETQYENNHCFIPSTNSVIIELEEILGNTRVLALIKEKEIAKVEYQ